MNRTDFAAIVGEAVRENAPGARVDLRGLRGGLYAIAAAILLLALLMLPVSILAVEAIYAQVLLYQSLDDHKTKTAGR